MNPLNKFQNDEFTREAVKTFFLERLDKLALERVYNKESTEGVADAKEVIENSFIELKELYSPNKKVEIVNRAR